MQCNRQREVAVFCVCFVFLIIQIIGLPALAVNTGDYKITVTKMSESQGFIGDLGLNPISSDVVDELSDIEYIDEIAPVVTLSYGNFEKDRPLEIAYDNPPKWNNSYDFPPPDRNMTRPDRDFNDGLPDMFDYIVEGIFLNSLSTFSYYTIPDDIISGRQLNRNDSSVVIIGEDAQDYFNVSINEVITIKGSNFTVIGVFSDENCSKYVFMNISDARLISNLKSDEYNTIYVYVEEEYLQSVSDAIGALDPELMTRYMGSMDFSHPPQFNEDTFNSADETILNQTPGFELIIGIFAIIIVYFIIYSTGEKKT